jgi:hypothetical protein
MWFLIACLLSWINLVLFSRYCLFVFYYLVQRPVTHALGISNAQAGVPAYFTIIAKV